MASCGRLSLGRPRHEVADIFRARGAEYRREHRPAPNQLKAMHAIESCRTAKLGGHLYVCDQCSHEVPAYNSCRNRHCPKCQSLAQARWIARRKLRVLDVHHFHVVFTLPEDLRSLVIHNKVKLFDLLFEAGSQTLLQLGRDPERLGVQLGISAVLHTWTRKLHFHGSATKGYLMMRDTPWTWWARKPSLHRNGAATCAPEWQKPADPRRQSHPDVGSLLAEASSTEPSLWRSYQEALPTRRPRAAIDP